MKKLLFISLLFLVGFGGKAQDWLWAEQCYGTNMSGDDHGNDIVTDDNGYSYVTGFFQDTVTFGSFTLYTPSDFGNEGDAFIAKYDPNGNVVWVRQAGGKEWDFGYGVSIDNLGNCYVTGSVTDTSYFETDTVFAPYSTVIFIAKYDTSGNYQWVKTAGSYLANQNLGTSIVNDAAGNIYATGVFQDTLIFDVDTLIGGKYYVAKFDPSGNCLWAIQDGMTNNAFPSIYVNKIAVDGSGNSYITGRFSDTLSYSTDTIIASGKADIFITKYNNAGNFQWTRQAGGSDVTNYDEGRDIVTNNGFIYVIGEFFDNGVFDTITIPSNGGSDVFISKWSKDGNIIWVKKAGGIGWWDIGTGIEISYDQKLYVTGIFKDTAYFDTLKVITPAGYDLFVARYDTLGNTELVIQSLGSTGTDYLYGASVSSDNFDNVYITGTFQGNGTTTLGNTTLTSTGFDDIVVAKIGTLENVIAEIKKPQFFNIYPNPTTGIFTVANATGEIQVFDLFGRLLLRTKEEEVDISSYPAGIYVVKAGEAVRKLILK